jgi:hypothetical protein
MCKMLVWQAGWRHCGLSTEGMSCALTQRHVHTDWDCQQHCFESFKHCKLQAVSVAHFKCELPCCTCVIKPTDALFIFSLLSHCTSTWFRLASSHVYMWQSVCVVRISRLSIPSRPADSWLLHTKRTSCDIYTLLPPDDGLLASLKHVEV